MYFSQSKLYPALPRAMGDNHNCETIQVFHVVYASLCKLVARAYHKVNVTNNLG